MLNNSSSKQIKLDLKIYDGWSWLYFVASLRGIYHICFKASN